MRLKEFMSDWQKTFWSLYLILSLLAHTYLTQTKSTLVQIWKHSWIQARQICWAIRVYFCARASVSLVCWGVSLYICFLNVEQCVQGDVWVWSGRCWQVRKGSIFKSAMVPLALVHTVPLGLQPGGQVGSFRDHAYSEDSKCEVWLVVFVNNNVHQLWWWCKLVKLPLIVWYWPYFKLQVVLSDLR